MTTIKTNYETKGTKRIKLASYLIQKGNISTPLRLQKMLFFMRYEEIENGISNDDSYFAEEGNFQAWVNGPVNYEVYRAFKLFFWGMDEKQTIIDNLEGEFEKIDSKYSEYYDKWNKLSTEELVEKSHKNKSWIEARGDLGDDEPSNEILKENTETIKIFIDEN